VPLSGQEIAAKDVAKAAEKPITGVAKSIFAEPKLQSVRLEDVQEFETLAPAREQGVEILNPAAHEQEVVESNDYAARDASGSGSSAVEMQTNASASDTGAKLIENLAGESAATTGAGVGAGGNTSESDRRVSPRTAAELLQQRLAQSASDPEVTTAATAKKANTAKQSAPAEARQSESGADLGVQQDNQGESDAKQLEAAAKSGAAGQTAAQPVKSQSSLQMDFSGLDRLTSDANPEPVKKDIQQPAPKPRLASLPNTTGTLEHAASAQIPKIPTNERLRNIPTISLGDSGMIPTQQAAFDEQASPSEQMYQPSDSLVSNTGSFAPLGATGMMKPVGEELLEYNDEEADIYIDDSDDSFVTGDSDSSGAQEEVVPNLMPIPKSRAKSFLGGLGDKLSGSSKKRGENLDSSPTSWLGVEDDFDARNAGNEIGSWDHFSEEEDEDGWKGGGYGGESDEENQEALERFSNQLIDKEVWLVALGSHENKNAGLKSFIHEHERDLRNALIINIDSVGAGELCFTASEGTFKTLSTDQRLRNLAEAAGRAVGVDLEPVSFVGYTTDASAALKEGLRAISILGLDQALPLGWRWSDDRLDIIDEDNLQAATDVVVEMIKSS
jgi:hypothetical protein